MILASSTGEIRFWESMSLALANVERFQSLQLDLGEDDFAERIWQVDVSSRLSSSYKRLKNPGQLFYHHHHYISSFPLDHRITRRSCRPKCGNTHAARRDVRAGHERHLREQDRSCRNLSGGFVRRGRIYRRGKDDTEVGAGIGWTPSRFFPACVCPYLTLDSLLKSTTCMTRLGARCSRRIGDPVASTSNSTILFHWCTAVLIVGMVLRLTYSQQ